VHTPSNPLASGYSRVIAYSWIALARSGVMETPDVVAGRPRPVHAA
jgi:hypothetical protein